MNLLAMPNLHGLTLFIWIVSVLTLSIGDEVKTDGTTSITFTNLSRSDHQNSLSIVQPTPVSFNQTETLNKNVVTSSFVGEAGPILIASTTQHVSPTASHLEKIPIDLNAKDNSSKAEDTAPNVIKKMTMIPKIVPRKEANEVLSVTKASTKVILSNNMKTIVESSTTSDIHNSGERVNADTNNSKPNITGKHSQDALNTTMNGNLHNQNVSQKGAPMNSNVTAAIIKEHKAKPTVTVAGPNSDKQMVYYDALVPSVRLHHTGMPKKIDYVLPVIITLIALPVLGAIIFMIYKQGRDCWDKRHYRRMDFLIDGMYND